MTHRSGLAAVFTSAGQPLDIREYPLLAPRPNDVRLRLRRSGICGTDIHIVTGRLPLPSPFIPGHEFIGEVDQMGADVTCDGLGQRFQHDDLAIACVAQPCGTCFTCAQGDSATCLNFGVSNLHDPCEAPHFFGGFAEVLQQPAANAVRVPTGLDLDAVAAFACAGPTVIRAFALAGPLAPEEIVVVQGTGPVGLFAVAWAAHAGCTVVAIGSQRNPERLELARALGAAHVLDYRQQSPEARLEFIHGLARERRRGNGADVVLEASGAPSAVPEGLNLVRTRGRYVIPGQYSNSGAIEIQPQLITFKAIRITGSGQYDLGDLAAYLEFLRRAPDLQKRLARAISHRFSVSDANRAIGETEQGHSIKGCFVP